MARRVHLRSLAHGAARARRGPARHDRDAEPQAGRPALPARGGSRRRAGVPARGAAGQGHPSAEAAAAAPRAAPRRAGVVPRGSAAAPRPARAHPRARERLGGLAQLLVLRGRRRGGLARRVVPGGCGRDRGGRGVGAPRLHVRGEVLRGGRGARGPGRGRRPERRRGAAHLRQDGEPQQQRRRPKHRRRAERDALGRRNGAAAGRHPRLAPRRRRARDRAAPVHPGGG
mmetsp:Transcript_388/g.994  ORF Transcript_388/g.994 Transcript_388/m.994 type:complete len:229 (-) Transcript_388:650-1336(-)